MKGLFGGLFDFNHDGKLDPFERTMEFAFLDEMISEEEKMDFEMAGFDADDYDFL